MSVNDTSEPTPLRVGILLDSWQQPHWSEQLFRQLLEMPSVEVALVVLHDTSNLPNTGGHLGERFVRSRNRLAHMAYIKLDDTLFGAEDDAFSLRDVEALFAGVATITVKPKRTKFSDRFEDEDVTAIASHRLDVILRHGFRILRGDILSVARHGLWSFHHGDNRVNRGGPPGTWEVFERESMTGATLQVLTETLDGGKVLGRVRVPTDSRSVRRNCNNLYWRALHLVPRTLQRLFEEGEAVLQGETSRFEIYDRRLYRWPSNVQSMMGLAGLAGRYVSDKVSHALYQQQWQLAFSLSERLPSPYKFRPIVPPSDRFWADPFPVERDGTYFIFIEEFLYAEQRGRIAVIEMDAKGQWSEPRPVLDLDTHLSYPHVFQWQDDFYMVPESAESNSVDLYKCTEFPATWQKVATLLDGLRAVDSTLAEIDGKWWLWTTLGVPGASTYDETHLYCADSPLGPFEPCRIGPVVSAPDVARCGGRVFAHGEHWVRTAQDCADLYGRATVFRRIDRLSAEDYAETEIGRIEPNWDPDIIATHTYNRVGKLHVIDLLRLRSRL